MAVSVDSEEASESHDESPCCANYAVPANPPKPLPPPPKGLTPLLIVGVLAGIIGTIVLWYGIRPTPGAIGSFCMVLLYDAAGAIISLHLLAANLDPRFAFVSEYADVHGYGVMMRTAFFWIALATFNLAKAIHYFMGPDNIMVWLMIAAGFLTIGMGIFSQRTTRPGEIHTSRFVGSVHGFCAGTSFGLAIITMVQFACAPPDKVDDWLRGAALAQFNIAVVVALIYYILGLGKVTEVLSAKPKLSRLQIVVADASATNILSKRGPYDHPLATENPDQPEDVDTLNRGLGLVERILIFMFLEWEMVLSWVVHSHTY